MGIYGKGEAMFRDTTAYGADDGARYAVLVGGEVVADGLVYGDALRLAQRTKGSRTSLQPAPVMTVPGPDAIEANRRAIGELSAHLRKLDYALTLRPDRATGAELVRRIRAVEHAIAALRAITPNDPSGL